MPALRLALIVAVGLSAVSLAGCDHVTEPDGPNLTDRFGEFNVLEGLAVDRETVDFAAGERAAFTARFNKQVEWVIEITGQESGAVRRIEGFSNEVNAGNAVWTGRTTDLPLFKNEEVEAILFVPDESSDTTRTTLTVAAPRDYPGIVAAAFEGAESITAFNPQFEFDFNGLTDEVPAGQGDRFYLLRGTDDNVVNDFFIGLITIRPPAGQEFFEVPTDIADELYFNCFLRGFGAANTIAVVELTVGGTNRPLGGDVEFPNLGIVDFDGWQLYSEPASSFGQFGAGLTDQQTQQISAIRVVLISDADNQTTPPNQVAFGIDYITFTAGGPLQL